MEPKPDTGKNARNRKGSILSSLMPVFAVPLVIMIMVFLFANFSTSIPTAGLDANATAAIDNVEAQSYNAFNMSGILPMVLIGILMIGLMVRAFGGL